MFFRYVSRSDAAVVLSQDIDAYNVQPLMPPVHGKRLSLPLSFFRQVLFYRVYVVGS
jgi:hypothetical protein